MKEQLINETEFGFRQVDESASGPKVTSRRPVGPLIARVVDAWESFTPAPAGRS